MQTQVKGFGEEIEEYKFNSVNIFIGIRTIRRTNQIIFFTFKALDWLIKINDPRDGWKAQPTYLISEWTYIAFGLLTFIHCKFGNCLFIQENLRNCASLLNLLAQRIGGRFRWLWLTCILHGIVLENFTFWTPEIDNFWHSQATIMLFGRRLPLHILFVCEYYRMILFYLSG